MMRVVMMNIKNQTDTDKQTDELGRKHTPPPSSEVNNTNANVYGTIIMAEPLREFTRFILMNVERRQAAADPQTKPNDLVCESANTLPESTPTVAICYYYSARKLILILPSRGV